MLGFLKLAPEIVKVLKLDKVPDVGQRGGDDGGFGYGGGGWDTVGHCEVSQLEVVVVFNYGVESIWKKCLKRSGVLVPSILEE